MKVDTFMLRTVGLFGPTMKSESLTWTVGPWLKFIAEYTAPCSRYCDIRAWALHDVARLGGASAVHERLTALSARAEGELVPAYAAHAAAAAAGDPVALVGAADRFERLGMVLLAAEAANGHAPIEVPFNEFSGPEYRIINFVADLPLRLERLIPKHEMTPELAHVVFVLTEFQVCDKATAQRNESGASSHDAYKQRQHERVRMRLFRDKDDPLPPD